MAAIATCPWATAKTSHASSRSATSCRSWSKTRRPAVREESAEHEGGAEALGLGDVARLRDEGGEVRVRHRAGVDAEGGQRDLPDRPFAVLGVAESVVAAHQEPPALDADHRGGGGAHRGGREGGSFGLDAITALRGREAAVVTGHARRASHTADA